MAAPRKMSLFGKLKSKSKATPPKSSYIEEKFHSIGKNMVVYKQGLKIKMKTNQWHTTYGALNISTLSHEKIYKWTLRITRQMTTPKMVIAISSKRDDGNTAFHHKHDRFFYGYCTKNGTKISSFDRIEQYYSKPCKHHDIIAMEFNISAKTLKYYKNSQDLGIAFNNINTRKTYCLSIAVFGIDSKVELQSFRCYKDNVDEEKTSATTVDNETNDKLQRENDLLCDNIDIKNGILFKRKETIKQQQNKIDNLRMIINKLKDDNKEIEYQHLELQKKIQSLKLQRLDKKNYHQWNTKQLIYWIIHLDYDSYKKYEKRLTEMFLKESIDGSCLKDIEAHDIDLWNIDVVQHKIHILNNIKVLTHETMETDVYIDMNTLGPGQSEVYIPSLPSLTPSLIPMNDYNRMDSTSVDNIANIPSDEQLDDIVPSTSGLGLDNIINIELIDESKQLEPPAPVGHYDSLDILQHKYLSQEINEREDNITPQ